MEKEGSKKNEIKICQACVELRHKFMTANMCKFSTRNTGIEKTT
jgi:hypothetical protein